MEEKAKTTSGLYTLSTGKVGALEVPVPPLRDQDGIVSGLAEQTRRSSEVRLAAEQELETICSLASSLLRLSFSAER
jgi:type I restriction enzyme S subunit